MVVPIENENFKSISCWCGICEYASGGCPIGGRWEHCDLNCLIELNEAEIKNE